MRIESAPLTEHPVPVGPSLALNVPDSGPPTPSAELPLLAVARIRRRQLNSALLHGPSRSWRDRRRVWPATAAGLVLVAMIISGAAVAQAYHRQQQIDATPPPSTSADR